MTERHRLVVPCSGFLVLALLSTSGVFVERLVNCTATGPPPRITAAATCSGERRRTPRGHVPRWRRPPYCTHH
ncbi:MULTISPECIES: hypothetical protein [Nocardiopsis]|uniref:Uncharacterized protein n=1 Tax=Nocardiopsis alba TaxID=53437 RepID=A0A7K2ILQ2_9ACTN|nr:MULTISPECIES: hypothetical protein [Nocardiopsis]MEC3895712.1 hypothetical protein [Nocardiopsis sp. LDBS1602]MYR30873.1 hypothetical protein [Nocardiopsis alba]